MVKVLSMIAERQGEAIGQQGRKARFVPFEEIRHSVRYLLSVQKASGSFGDPHPVQNRGVLVIVTPDLFAFKITFDLNASVFHRSMAKMGKHL